MLLQKGSLRCQDAKYFSRLSLRPAAPVLLRRGLADSGCNLVRPIRTLVASPTSLLSSAGEVDVSGQAVRDVSPFSWTSRWWPAVPLDSLDTKIPKHVDLLGKSLVVWADSKGSWHCLEDRCPHRQAPLSEGRVEKDTIMCCYHGWCFSGSGACTRIPQLETDAKVHQVACSSQRSAVTAYPTRVEHGILWVWPEAGDAAAATATATPINEAVESEGRTPWFVRHIPIRYDTLMENILDPTHVPFAHHGLQGNRNKPGVTWMSLVSSPVTRPGFVATAPSPFGPMDIRFHAPGVVSYMMNGVMGGPQVMAVPTTPGRVLVWTNFPLDLPSSLGLPAPILLLYRIKMKMTAVDHVTNRNEIFDGDTYMLHLAERLMPVTGGVGMAAAARHYYLPGACDSAVVSLRKWFGQFGGNIPTCSPGDEALMPPVMTKEQVLDRWSQHTKDCKYCLGLLAALDRTRVVAAAVGALAAVVAVASAVAAAALPHLAGFTAAASSTSSSMLPAGLAGWWQAAQSAGLQQLMATGAAVALLALWLHNGLGNWRQNFFYKDYVHAVR